MGSSAFPQFHVRKSVFGYLLILTDAVIGTQRRLKFPGIERNFRAARSERRRLQCGSVRAIFMRSAGRPDSGWRLVADLVQSSSEGFL